MGVCLASPASAICAGGAALLVGIDGVNGYRKARSDGSSIEGSIGHGFAATGESAAWTLAGAGLGRGMQGVGTGVTVFATAGAGVVGQKVGTRFADQMFGKAGG